jgi:hypothetical protein
MSSKRFIDCDFTTGECPVCGYVAKPGTHKNCYSVGGGPEPGTELRKLLREIGVKLHCQECRKYAFYMNKLGIDGCREHRPEIIQRLKEAASESSWSTLFSAGAGLMTKPWFSILDPLGSIVDEAIRRSEQ